MAETVKPKPATSTQLPSAYLLVYSTRPKPRIIHLLHPNQTEEHTEWIGGLEESEDEGGKSEKRRDLPVSCNVTY